jgi:hypothetical protein
MTKKDEKDADRPHYYPQFWLDVAAGRRVIGAPKPEDDGDLADVDLPEPTPLVRKGGRINANSPLDGYKETRATAAVAEPDYEEEELIEPDEDIIEPADQVDDEDIPNIVDDTPEVVSVEVEPASADEEEELDEGEEFFDEEEEEEEEEDEEWPARGRKKPKPGRPVKAPKPPVKKPKRGRGF